MPLDRAHQTSASAIMLWAYPALNAIVGLTFLADPAAGRSPAYNPASDIAPLWVWGCVWTATALGLVTARIRENREWYELALVANRYYWLAWSALVAVAIFTEETITPIAVAFPVFVGIACWASLRSLRAFEVTPARRVSRG